MFILPSRGRPHNIKRLVDAWGATNATADVCLYLDTDDPTRDYYKLISYPPNWTIHLNERQPNPIWHINNSHFRQFPDEPWYGAINDDMLPRTQEWDKALIDAAGDNYIAYGADLLQGQRMCTFPVIGGELVRRVGRLMFDGINLDAAWMLFGFHYGLLRYRPDIILEHLHYSNGKAPFDETYNIPEEIRQGGSVDATVKFLEYVVDQKTEDMIASWNVERYFPKELMAAPSNDTAIAKTLAERLNRRS